MTNSRRGKKNNLSGGVGKANQSVGLRLGLAGKSLEWVFFGDFLSSFFASCPCENPPLARAPGSDLENPPLRRIVKSSLTLARPETEPLLTTSRAAADRRCGDRTEVFAEGMEREKDGGMRFRFAQCGAEIEEQTLIGCGAKSFLSEDSDSVRFR